MQLTTGLRGDVPLPALPERFPVAWRAGIEIAPIDLYDADALTWLRALIWPEHVERHARLLAAIKIAKRDPPRIIAGDAVELLSEVLAEAPHDATLCVYATFTVYQLSPERRHQLLRAMRRHGATRPLAVVSMENTGNDHAELTLTRYERGGGATVKLANCNPHGRWIEWLATPPQTPSEPSERS